MSTLETGRSAHLVVLRPQADRDRRVQVDRDRLVVGREPTCDVRFVSPQVSRTHAALLRRDGHAYVQDLGSTGGTYVNGGRVTGQQELRSGDVVAFADVELRFDDGRGADVGTDALPAQRGPAVVPAPTATRFDIDGQHAERDINNVARDQYIAYVQRRDSFLRDVAATRTRARWLVVGGLVLVAVGFAMFAAGVLAFLADVGGSVSSGDLAPPDNPFGRAVFGVPSGLLGWALAAVGSFLLVVGLVLHVVATSRRKRVERDFPMPSAEW
jgi:hypothetical protein